MDGDSHLFIDFSQIPACNSLLLTMHVAPAPRISIKNLQNQTFPKQGRYKTQIIFLSFFLKSRNKTQIS